MKKRFHHDRMEKKQQCEQAEKFVKNLTRHRKISAIETVRHSIPPPLRKSAGQE
jgi:predicted GIY-YIG superfamily endonuclease